MLCDGFTYFSQKVGVTTTVPDQVPPYLPLNDASSDEWYYEGNTLYHNLSSTNFSHLPSFHGRNDDDKVGLLLLPNGELHLLLDGKHFAKFATGLPVHKPLFGAVDVYARCTKIKSEILSGEFDGVCLCTCIYIATCVYIKYMYNTEWRLSYCNL